MIRTEPIIAVSDVEHCSNWYQQLLGCVSLHGGGNFEILADPDGTVVLCLHKWATHDHPPFRAPVPNNGNGLILYFRVTDLEAIWQNAQGLNAKIDEEPHLNENSGKREFSLFDPEGYYLIVSL